MSEHVYIAEHRGTKEPPLTQPGDEGETETECHFSCVSEAQSVTVVCLQPPSQAQSW